jgi:hypothetical protein
MAKSEKRARERAPTEVEQAAAIGGSAMVDAATSDGKGGRRAERDAKRAEKAAKQAARAESKSKRKAAKDAAKAQAKSERTNSKAAKKAAKAEAKAARTGRAATTAAVAAAAPVLDEFAGLAREPSGSASTAVDASFDGAGVGVAAIAEPELAEPAIAEPDAAETDRQPAPELPAVGEAIAEPEAEREAPHGFDDSPVATNEPEPEPASASEREPERASAEGSAAGSAALPLLPEPGPELGVTSETEQETEPFAQRSTHESAPEQETIDEPAPVPEQPRGDSDEPAEIAAQAAGTFRDESPATDDHDFQAPEVPDGEAPSEAGRSLRPAGRAPGDP